MISKAFLVLVLSQTLTNFALASSQNPREVTLATFMPEISECGGVLTENSNRITYKEFEQVEDNERCVWIVAVPNAASYKVMITSGFEEKLSIGGLKRRNQMQYPQMLNDSSTIFEANVLVIAFQSPPNATAKGFAIEYEVNSTTDEFSSDSSHSFIDHDTNYLKFPLNNNYSNYELSTLVYPVTGNIYRRDVRKYLVYKQIRIEPNNYDFVDVYYFASDANQFVFVERLGYAADVRQFSSDDVILVTFHSDYSIVYEGFSMTSVVTSCPA